MVQQYEDPVKALVHKLLEEYVEQSFQEFMGDRIGQIIERESDGKAIKDYRKGYHQVNQAVVDSLVMDNFRILRNRAGGFKTNIFAKLGRRAGIFAQLAKELYVDGVSTRNVRRSFDKTGMKISGLCPTSCLCEVASALPP